MIDFLPSGHWICKVHFPRPIVYTFNLSGLFCFVWAKDFDNKNGKHESNRRTVIRQFDSLRFNDSQREPARSDEYFLSVNGHTMWRIVEHHAATKPDRSFGNDDMKLFFDNPSSALNDANRWIEDLTDQLIRYHPEKQR